MPKHYKTKYISLNTSLILLFLIFLFSKCVWAQEKEVQNQISIDDETLFVTDFDCN